MKSMAMKGYFVAYNAILLLGWTAICIKSVSTIAKPYFESGAAGSHGGMPAVFATVEDLLLVCQTAAVMEILHVALGVVRSPLFATVLQVFSRVGLVWFVTWPFKEVQVSQLTLMSLGKYHFGFSAGTMIVAWSLSEMIRYSYYLIRELQGSNPFISTWLRYSGFIVLYPIGVASELSCCYLALPYIRETKLGVWPRLGFDMPNAWNIFIDAYQIFVACLFLYFPGLPYLYMYMLKQRNKALAPKAKEA